MKLFARIIDQKTYLIEVDKEDTVSILKDKIVKKVNDQDNLFLLKGEIQTVFFIGKIMENDRKVMSYEKMGDLSTVVIMLVHSKCDQTK